MTIKAVPRLREKDCGRAPGQRMRLALMLMEFGMEHGNPEGGRGGFFASRVNIALIAFLAIGGYFLVTEHRAHLIPYLGYWPFLLILACPLLHIFMHGGHGDHGGSGNADGGSADGRQNTPPHQH